MAPQVTLAPAATSSKVAAAWPLVLKSARAARRSDSRVRAASSSVLRAMYASAHCTNIQVRMLAGGRRGPMVRGHLRGACGAKGQKKGRAAHPLRGCPAPISPGGGRGDCMRRMFGGAREGRCVGREALQFSKLSGGGRAGFGRLSGDFDRRSPGPPGQTGRLDGPTGELR